MGGASRSRSFRTALVVLGILAAGTALARRMGYEVGGNVVVRCRQGHVFRTLWIPGIKLKAIDLGIARIQHCPVGRHWSLVVPIRDRDLTTSERLAAAKYHDIRIP
jgi:hypothetical protein